MKRYSIHSVAELLGISADAIRLYEKEGLVRPLRDENNGYRYYENEQIHRIMGIHLYRQLNVGLAEIKRMFGIDTFEGLEGEFDRLIENNEAQIEYLRRKSEKLRFMKQHIENVRRGLDGFEIRELPARYVAFEFSCLSSKLFVYNLFIFPVMIVAMMYFDCRFEINLAVANNILVIVNGIYSAKALGANDRSSLNQIYMTVLIDNNSNLYSASEEISAASEETTAMCTQNSDRFKDVNRVVEELAAEAARVNEYIEQYTRAHESKNNEEQGVESTIGNLAIS